MKMKRHIIASALLVVLPGSLFALNHVEPPLPKIETLLQRVADRAEKESENTKTFQERYAFTRNRVTEYRNADGEVKKREEKSRQNQPAPKVAAPRVQLAVASRPKAESVKATQPVS